MDAETIQFLLTTLMELATLLCAYGAVRLYKKKWQPRMVLLLVPLLINAVCYAVYRTTVFFYLGVILLLCIPFVWPRKSA